MSENLGRESSRLREEVERLHRRTRKHVVDGEDVDGITVPDFGDGETHDVRVVLG